MSEIVTNFEHMMRRYLTSAIQSGAERLRTTDPEAKAVLSSHAALAGMCAFLLAELHNCDNGTGDDTAQHLDGFDQDGEALDDWVVEWAPRFGINPETLIQAVLTGEVGDVR